MRKKPLIWYLFPTYLIVTLAAVLAITGYATRSIQHFYSAHITRDLEARARILHDRVLDQLTTATHADVDRLCEQVGGESNTRITVALPTGEVIGDTEEAPANMDNHARRPEILEAYATGLGTSVRHSDTLDSDMMYVALPLGDAPPYQGVVRVAVPVTRISAALWAIRRNMAAAGAVVVVFAVLVSLWVARRMSQPLERMKRGADQFAQGDLAHALPIPNSLEMASLAEAMNQMARQLDDRIRTIVNQRNQQEAVLSSMVEGVLAVDTEECVISANEAAGRLLGFEPERAQGRPLASVVGNPALRDFINEALASSGPRESEVVVYYERDERILQVHGTVLRDAHGNRIGAVVVLNDVTRLRRLERVRRDFVANVSHELRTPITSIKGFVETLLDGALEEAEDARHFLEIVAKQADRLNAILGDLLTLSRIEEGEERATISLEVGAVYEPLEAAVQMCAGKAGAKGLHIEWTCSETARARINPHLLEQAVANLVDNAIKYSEPESTVRVRVVQHDGELVIEVADEGCGIPAEYLPRLFERFYRVDKARSRNLGGTGLGLAIVKHIAKTHSGRVTVESTPGAGSTFRIHIPAP